MRVHGVSDAAIASASETLADSLDVLLDRLATKATSAPAPGTSLWNMQWGERDSALGVERRRRHALTRIAIAARVGISITADVELAAELGASAAEVAEATGRVAPPPAGAGRGAGGDGGWQRPGDPDAAAPQAAARVGRRRAARSVPPDQLAMW